MEDQIAVLAELFRQAAAAHHAAFSATDGDDPDWPLWYADYMYDKLAYFLSVNFTVDDVANYLVQLDQEVRGGAAGDNDWATYFAQSFLSQAS